MRITKVRDTLRHEAQAAEATRPGRGSLGTRGAPGLGLRSPVRVDSGRPAERAVRDPTVPSSWNAEHQSSFLLATGLLRLYLFLRQFRQIPSPRNVSLSLSCRSPWCEMLSLYPLVTEGR